MKENEKLLQALRMVAPGTPLREGLENILRAKTGALIVVNDSPEVLALAEAGFELNTEFRPSALYELAKMDGAIILSSNAQALLKANVHLVPLAAIPSQETGTRHRVAERVARQTGSLVIAISQRREVITLYLGVTKYILRDTAFILSKADQALQALDKYCVVLRRFLNDLSLLELEGIATVADVARALRQAEIVRRVSEEIAFYSLELGSEGRLVGMQREELVTGLEEAQQVWKDYLVSPGEKNLEQLLRTLSQASGEELLDLVNLSRLLGYGGTLSSLDQSVTPRGYRALQKLPRLPVQVVENLVASFGSLPRVMSASPEELDEVEGIGEARAKAIRDGLRRQREQALLDGRPGILNL